MKVFSQLFVEPEDEPRNQWRGETPFTLRPSLGEAAPHLSEWSPPVDIYETETELVLLMDVPGIDRQDIEVELTGDVLTIRGQKRLVGSQEGERYHQVESAYGPFERSFVIRLSTEPQAVKASFKNGVLRVTLPKPGRGPRSIPVEST